MRNRYARPLATLTTLLTVLLLSNSRASAQGDEGAAVEFPDTPAGAVAAEFFEAIATGELAAFIAFENAFRSDEELAEESADARANDWVGLYNQAGSLLALSVTESTHASISVRTTSTKIPIPLLATFEVNPETGKLESVSIRPAPADNADTASIDALLESNWSDLSELLNGLIDASGAPSIAARVTRDGEVLWEAAVGVRRADEETPVTLDDRYHVGSVTKSMTATVVGKLVEDGVLDWDQTVADVWPEMDIHPEMQDVTIEQLLQHRSGMLCDYSVEDESVYPADDPVAAREIYVAGALALEPEFDRTDGASNYSNAGFITLGHAAETATGVSWEALMTDIVFEHAGMTEGGFGWPHETDAASPYGHDSTSGDFKPLTSDDYKLGFQMAPAGDVHCSIRDLSAFAQAHLDGLNGKDSVIEASTLVRLHTPIAADDTRGRNYAGGWGIRDRNGNIVHSHNGSAGTFFADMLIDPESDVTVVVATNAGIEVASMMGDLLIALHKRAIAE